MCYENWHFCLANILIFEKFVKYRRWKKIANFHSTFKYEQNMVNNIPRDQKNLLWVVYSLKLLELKFIFCTFSAYENSIVILVLDDFDFFPGKDRHI